MERSGFFNSLKLGSDYDRKYDASDFARFFSLFIGDGVFVNPTDQLKVVSKKGLTVTIKKGNAFIDGYWYVLDEDIDITLNVNNTSYEITDLICCTLNKTNREIRVNKKEKMESLLPVNDGSVHELVLASINVPVGSSAITDANITDRRSDRQYCGFVKGIVEQITEENLFLQFETAFQEWFDNVKGALSGDIAGKLLQQIEEIKNTMPVIRGGTEPPDNSIGKDGDIYIQYIE